MMGAAAPPSRRLTSTSVTLAPAPAHCSAAAIPARPPPITTTRRPELTRLDRSLCSAPSGRGEGELGDLARAQACSSPPPTPSPRPAATRARAPPAPGAAGCGRAAGGRFPPSRARRRRCACRAALSARCRNRYTADTPQQAAPAAAPAPPEQEGRSGVQAFGCSGTDKDKPVFDLAGLDA